MRRKIFGLIICLLLMNTVCLLPVSAYGEVSVHESIDTLNGGSIVPYADRIETRYRTYKGVKQYRRYNLTKKCWVDPKWINL